MYHVRMNNYLGPFTQFAIYCVKNYTRSLDAVFDDKIINNTVIQIFYISCNFH